MRLYFHPPNNIWLAHSYLYSEVQGGRFAGGSSEPAGWKKKKKSRIPFRTLYLQMGSPGLRAVCCWVFKDLSAREALWACNLTINHTVSRHTHIPAWGGWCGSNTTCHTDRRQRLITSWFCIFLVCTSVLSKLFWSFFRKGKCLHETKILA